ncbi:MAG: ABC transporter ATP-binding protein [Armatimonadetes bacterium]|nr:ABC transporter ATP-binding protein [Armatimonadota bacterium]
MAVAEVNSLTVKYGDTVAVSNLTCTVPEGCVGLLGPNGAGKSTLIKALLGFIEPASGGGTVFGRDISTDGLSIRMDVGLMPELECYIPGLTAVEYTAFAGELAGMPREQAMRRSHEVLEYCGLGEARYRNLETYSTGMKQKAKLAQAIVHGPKLLFLDEPTNGLDPAGRDEMLALVKDISHGKGVNVVVSSHLLPDIERTCDFVIVMQKGEVRSQDTVARFKSVSQVQWDVELKIPAERFAEALAKRSGEVVSSLSYRYRVQFPEGFMQPTQAVFSAAAESGAQVRVLQPAQRTLEDAFLEALV